MFNAHVIQGESLCRKVQTVLYDYLSALESGSKDRVCSTRLRSKEVKLTPRFN